MTKSLKEMLSGVLGHFLMFVPESLSAMLDYRGEYKANLTMWSKMAQFGSTVDQIFAFLYKPLPGKNNIGKNGVS